MHRFSHILHEVPTILDVLPPAALKNLSATCRTLRASFCARVTVITVSAPTDLSKLCCTTWPQLMMVVCTIMCTPFDTDAEARGQLSADWENMMEVELLSPGGCLCSRTTVMLVRSHQQLNSPLPDLPSQHCIAVSGFADKHRDRALAITLQGPCVGFRAVQSLTKDVWPAVVFLKMVEAQRLEEGSMSLLTKAVPLLQSIIQDPFVDMAALLKLSTAGRWLHTIKLSNNQLDASAVSSTVHVNWPQLRCLLLNSSMLDAACMQHLTDCSWPALQMLSLEHADIDALALHCLAQGQWPAVLIMPASWLWQQTDCALLDLLDTICKTDARESDCHRINGIVANTVGMILSDQGLGAEACSLLGIAEVVRFCSAGVTVEESDYKSHLSRFSDLTVQICRS